MIGGLNPRLAHGGATWSAPQLLLFPGQQLPAWLTASGGKDRPADCAGSTEVPFCAENMERLVRTRTRSERVERLVCEWRDGRGVGWGGHGCCQPTQPTWRQCVAESPAEHIVGQHRWPGHTGHSVPRPPSATGTSSCGVHAPKMWRQLPARACQTLGRGTFVPPPSAFLVAC